jgi:hypothetical protein
MLVRPIDTNFSRAVQTVIKYSLKILTHIGMPTIKFMLGNYFW